MCLVNSSFRKNEVGHSGQGKGRGAPVWSFSCRVSLSLRLNGIKQTEQIHDLTPVCTTSCRFRSLRVPNIFPQSSQVWGLFPVWIRACLFKLVLRVNDFLQIEHSYGLIPGKNNKRHKTNYKLSPSQCVFIPHIESYSESFQDEFFSIQTLINIYWPVIFPLVEMGNWIPQHPEWTFLWNWSLTVKM